MGKGKFEELNRIINTVLQEMLGSQLLLKYLFYSEENPAQQPDITSPSSLLFEHIYPFFKIPDTEEDMRSFVNVVIGDVVPYNNTMFRSEDLFIYVGCHIDKWKVDGGLRPYFILNEIDKILNRSDISEISLNFVNFKRLSPMPFGNRFYGYVLKYQLSNNSNLTCGE